MSTIWESRNVRNAAETAAFLGKKEPCFPKIQHGGAWKSIFGLLKLPEKGYFTLHMLRFQLKALHNRCVSCIERAGVQKSSSRRCHWKSRVQVTSPAVRAQSDKCWIAIGQHLWLHPSIRKKLSFHVLSFLSVYPNGFRHTTTSWPSMDVIPGFGSTVRLQTQVFFMDPKELYRFVPPKKHLQKQKPPTDGTFRRRISPSANGRQKVALWMRLLSPCCF